MKTIKCKGCAHYRRTPIAVNDIGGGAYETACDLSKGDEFFTEEGCGEYAPAEDKGIRRVMHGQWSESILRSPNGSWRIRMFSCSVCGGFCVGESKYCPNCGAKMDAQKEGDLC